MLAATPEAKSKRTQRERLFARWEALRSERSSWFSHWQEITEFLLPRAGRYFAQDRNRGKKRHQSIIDATGLDALHTMSAGIMSGASSPARPWFRLTVTDPDMAKDHAVKMWLEQVTERIQRALQASNAYRALHQMYEELGAFGTAACIVVPDFESVLHFYPLTAGEYCLATDYRNRVCTLYREFEKPVGAVVKEFGYDKCSNVVKGHFDRGELDVWVPLIHAIEPRQDRDASKADSLNMAWRSCYFEKDSQEKQVLRESGFEKFPVLAPRWVTTSSDVYGQSPGMEALGAVKQLQLQQVRMQQGLDKMTNPPLQAPIAMKDRDVDMLPGGVSFVADTGPNTGIRTLYDVNLPLNYLGAEMEQVRGRIRTAFFADLFRMFADADASTTRMTATEVAERHEEKMTRLGPVMENLQNELHEPLVEMVFDRLLETDSLPPPPAAMANGAQVKVEFVSMLAQAQRAIGTNATDRYVANLASIAGSINEDVKDKLDTDYWADNYGDMLGVDPRMIRSTEQVQQIRDARNRAMAAKEQAAMLPQTAAAASDFANAASTPAGADIMGLFSGYQSPTGVEAGL